MCGIVGITKAQFEYDGNLDVSDILLANGARGRDSWGSYLWASGTFDKPKANLHPGSNITSYLDGTFGRMSVGAVEQFLFNTRAEPTTQRLLGAPTEADTQPYIFNNWAIVHNGIISNDEKLVKQLDLSPPTPIDSWVIVGALDRVEQYVHDSDPLANFCVVVDSLKGSYAIIALHRPTGRMFYACNYRPIYKAFVQGRWVISSVAVDERYEMIKPYSMGEVTPNGISSMSLLRPVETKRALVVCSGGLDSTVVAAKLLEEGYDVELLHYIYGCRATQNEIEAVKNIAEHYGIKARFVETDIFSKVIQHSRLLDPNAEFAETVAGAETAFEWVPARNIILSSIAIGIAEAHKFDTIALGGNLEESGGGYPDNTFELWEGLNALMPFAVGVGVQIKFVSPVANLMKHEIAAEAIRLGVPEQLTWSCYNKGEKHCGKCGPCFMRKTAFEMNGVQDRVFLCE